MKRIIILFCVLLVVVVGGWYIATRTVSAPTVPDVTKTSSLPQTTENSRPPTAPLSTTINYTAGGFSPVAIAIKQGGTVIFTSIDGSPMWVASAIHPTHLVYDGTSRTEHCPNPTDTAFDQCSNGTSYSFTFLKTGVWKYHNHMSAGDGGIITVIQ